MTEKVNASTLNGVVMTVAHDEELSGYRFYMDGSATIKQGPLRYDVAPDEVPERLAKIAATIFSGTLSPVRTGWVGNNYYEDFELEDMK